MIMYFIHLSLELYVLSSVLWRPRRCPVVCRKARICFMLVVFVSVYSCVQDILTIWVTLRMTYNKKELLTLWVHLGSPSVFGGVRVTNLFSFLCCLCMMGSSRLWSYGSWIYNYICNQCLSPMNLDQCEVYNIIKFVSELRQVRGFLRALSFPPPIKLTATI